MNNEPTAAKTERHVRDAVDRGAIVLAGGSRAAEHGSDLFFDATVLDGVTAGDGDRARGDVRPGRAGLDDPIRSTRRSRAVNDSPYGLLSAIFTRDLGRGLRFAESVRAGWVNVNEGTNYWESHLPFGGRAGSQSGVGRVGGRFSMDRLTELKTVVLDLG